MKIPAAVLAVGALLASGCATKKYVLNTTSPIQAKVDQVGDQTNRNSAAIEEARKEIKAVDERAEAGIGAAKESAMAADGHAGRAEKKADAAAEAAADARSQAGKNARDIGALRQVVANIDDYKLKAEGTVLFGFGQYILTPESKEQLDKLVLEKGSAKRYVIAVEGFTDQLGPAEYNTRLSQRRATSVVNYLVAKHSIPVYRIHMVGLGKEKLADEGKTRESRSKNRRVEVRIFSADPGPGELAAINNKE